MTNETTETVETEAETAETPTEESQDASQEAAPETNDAAHEAAPLEIPEDYRGADGNADVAKMLARIDELSAPPEGIPESPEGYELKLNEEIELFDGQKVQLNAEDPALKDFFSWAHKNKINQEAFQEGATLYAKAQAEMLKQQYTVTNQQVQQEIAKLGDNPEARISNLMSSVGKAIGSEEGAFALLKDVRSVEAFQAVEKLMGALNGQGGGRAPALNGAIQEQPPLAARLFGKVN